jgi:hypothetical protein
MPTIAEHIKAKRLIEVKSADSVSKLRVVEFIFVNDTRRVVSVGNSRCPFTYMENFYSRCRGRKIDNTSYMSFTRLTESTTKHEWRIYASTNNKFGADGIISDVVRETGYMFLGRLPKYKNNELKKTNFSMFKVTANKSTLVRYIHTRTTTPETVIIGRVLGNLRSGMSSSQGNRVKLGMNPKWPEIREAFMTSTEFKVTRMEDHEYNLDKLKSATTVSRDLNNQAIREAK